MTSPERLDALISRSLTRLHAFHSQGVRRSAADESGILISRLIERYPESLAKLGRLLAGPLHAYHGLCYQCGVNPPEGVGDGQLCGECAAGESDNA